MTDIELEKIKSFLDQVVTKSQSLRITMFRDGIELGDMFYTSSGSFISFIKSSSTFNSIMGKTMTLDSISLSDASFVLCVDKERIRCSISDFDLKILSEKCQGLLYLDGYTRSE